MAEERNNVATSNGNPVTLLGPEIRTGEAAPEFSALNQDLSVFQSSSLTNRVRIYNVVQSLDTGVCDQQTRRFNEEAAKLGDKVDIVTISVDLPFAQRRWCGAAGIERVKVVSDHRDLSFGSAYGVVIKELRLIARSLFVVDSQNVVRHVEYVKELSTHPDYEAALNVVRSLL